MYKTLHKFAMVLANFSILVNTFLTPITVYAQDSTPTETPAVVTETVSPDPQPTTDNSQPVDETPAPTTEPTPEVTVEPTTTPTVEPTVEVTPTPEISPEPTTIPDGQAEGTSTETPTEGTPEIEAVTNEENAFVAAVVLEDVNADSITEEEVVYDSSGTPTLQTDQADYAPTDVVLISGTGFEPNKEYDLIITGTGDFRFDDKVRSDESGGLFYIYQLDGTYRPDYKVEVKVETGDTVASVLFTDTDASISVSKVASDTTINQGDTATYTIIVTAGGATGTIAQSTVLTDQLPTGTWVLGGAGAGFCSINGSNLLTCNFGDLPKGTSRTITVSQNTIGFCGEIINNAHVTAINSHNGNVIDDDDNNNKITVENCIDVSVVKTGNNISSGSDAKYTITVKNESDLASGTITLSDTLPAGFGNLIWVLDGVLPSGVSCTLVANVLSCTVNSLTANQTKLIKVKAPTQADDCGIITNTANISVQNDGNPSNNSSTDDVAIVCKDIEVIKVGNGPVNVGQSAQFTVTVGSVGGESANDVVLTDTLPSGTWTVNNTSGSSCDQNATGSFTCTNIDLGVSGSRTYTVTRLATVNDCPSLTNNVSVSVASEEGPTNNNSASATIDINGCTPATGTVTIHKNVLDEEGSEVSDLQSFTVKKDSSDAQLIAEGTDAVYTLTPGTYTFTEDPEDDYSLDSIIGDNDSNASNGATVTVVAGQDIELTFVNKQVELKLCHADGQSGNYSEISISPSGAFNGHLDDNFGGNTNHQNGNDIIPPFDYQGTTYSQNWDVAGQAIWNNDCDSPETDVKITKTDSPDPVTSGGELTYTLTIENESLIAADSVIVTDSLPGAVLSIVSVIPSQGACSDSTLPSPISCELGTIAGGGSATVTVKVIVSGTEVIENTANVTTTTSETDLTDNEDKEETTVVDLPSRCEQGVRWATSISGAAQGLRKDGTPVLPARSIPASVLGVPNATTGPDSGFYSLGKGGSVTVAIANSVVNGSGTDISVHEVTNGREAYPLETASVEVFDGSWHSVGTALSTSPSGVTYLDIAPYTNVTMIRITDTTNFALNPDANADGFDVDAVDVDCKSTITVNKDLDTDGDGKVDETNTEGWTWDLNGAGNFPMGSTQDVLAGNYTLSEDNQVGYHFVQLYCNDVLQNGPTPEVEVGEGSSIICTYTNVRDTGSVKVNKRTDANGDGDWNDTGEGVNGSASNAFYWTLDTIGPNTFGDTVNDVPTGSHDVDENSVAGYHFTGWYVNGERGRSCTNPNDTTLPAVVMVATGQTKEITLCNQRDTGTIRITKDAINNDSKNFEFDTNFDTNPNQGGNQLSFQLDDDSNGSLPNTRLFTLPTGSYTVQEDLYSDWKLTDLECSDENNSDTDLNNREATLSLETGENIVCTFTNTELGSIEGIKYNDKDGDGGHDFLEPRLNNWTIFIDENDNGTYDDGELTDTTSGTVFFIIPPFIFPAGEYEFKNLLPGEYTVCEVPKEGWTNSTDLCKTVTVGPGDEKEVKFGNHEPLTLGAYKVVCETEAYLPNWGDDDAPNITSTTAQNFVDDANEEADREVCWLQEGWDFQYGFDGEVSKYGNGDQLGAAPEPWQTLGTTDSDGYAETTLTSLEGADGIWVREELKEDYVPFSYPPAGPTENPYSAEIYCSRDGDHYDNFDQVEDPKFGETYYCVAFNALNNGDLQVCKYDDYDGDGKKDEGEPGISGVTMSLSEVYESEQEVGESVQDETGRDGCVLWEDLELGSYQVKEELSDLPGYTPTADYENGSTDETADGEIEVTVEPGQTTLVEFLNKLNPVTITLEKFADEEATGPGDIIFYTLKVKNTSDHTAYDAQVSDFTPFGFTYQTGTTEIDDAPSSDPSISGPVLTWQLGTLTAGQEVKVEYQMKAPDTLSEGTYTNIAIAKAYNRSSEVEVSQEASLLDLLVSEVSATALHPAARVSESQVAFDVVRYTRGISFSSSVGGQVLGTSTVLGAVLPASGSETYILWALLSTLALGVWFKYLGAKSGSKK